MASSRPRPQTKSKEVQARVQEQERRQTITITTKNKTAEDSADPDGTGKRGRKGIKKCKSMDATSDLPRTAKPKGKMMLPGSGGLGRGKGRGVGRSLSREDAKEKTLANPYAKKRKPPARSQTMPLPAPRRGGKKPDPKKKKDKEEEEEPPEQEEDDAEDENQEEEEQAKKEPPKKSNGKAPPPATSKPGKENNGKTQQGSRQSVQKQPAKKTATTTPAAKSPPAPRKSATKKRDSSSDPDKNKVPIVVYMMNVEDATAKIQLLVDPTKDTLKDLKKDLQVKTKVPIKNQRISGKQSGIVYDVDHKSLFSYGIKKDSEVECVLYKLPIQAKIMPQGGTLIPLQVSSLTSINIIKDKITKATELKASEQELYFNGKELSDGDKTLKYIKGMQAESIIVVEVASKVPITVRQMNKDETATVKLLVNLRNDGLASIQQSLAKQTKVSVDNQKLFLDDDELVQKKYDTQVLQDFGIEEDSELYLEPKIIKITVELPDGKSEKLKVAPSSDMSEIIGALVKTAVKTDLNGKKHVLKFQGQEFPKGKTVKDMGLQDGSAVKLDLN